MSTKRWIVRNRVLTPECGNGVWTRHRTWLGARISLVRILRFRHGSGFYSIPSGGLSVYRASEAGPTRWSLHFARGRNILGQPVCNECSPLQPMPCPTLRALSSGDSEDRT